LQTFTLFHLSTPARLWWVSTFQQSEGLKACSCHNLENQSEDAERDDEHDSSDENEHDRLYHFRHAADHII
jgi:hypothetical protein